MATADERADWAAQRAAQQFAEKLRQMAKTPRPTGFVVPIVDDDPPPEDPTNLWGFADGRIMFRTPNGTVHEFNKIPTHATTTTTVPKPADPEPKGYRKTYDAQWGTSFCSIHGAEGGGDLYYGQKTGSSHGERKIMIGFDDAQIRTDTAGATIRKVELHAVNKDSYLNSGVELRWGLHNRHTTPGSYSAVRYNAWHGHWPHVGDGDYWRNIGTIFGRWMRDNQAKGLTINQGVPNAQWGQIDWSTVRLRIQYTK